MNTTPPRSRLLNHTPGTLEPLVENAAHQLAQKHALVHYASKAVFTFIPKNACTSLRTSLALANGAISSVEDWTWVHKNNHTFSASLPDLATASHTAVVLRCPHKRLVSTFLDKIVSRSGELWTLFRKSHDTIDPDQFTFREFVDWIGKPGFLYADIHWRPQTDFFVYKTYDRVFGMHQLAQFAEFFESSTGQPFVDSRKFSGHVTSTSEPMDGSIHADTPLSKLTFEKSEGRLPKPATMFDEDLKQKVAKLYAKDIERYSELIGQEDLLFPGLEPKENS